MTGRWRVMVRWAAVFMCAWIGIALAVRVFVPQVLGTTGWQSIMVGVAVIGAAGLVATIDSRRNRR